MKHLATQQPPNESKLSGYGWTRSSQKSDKSADTFLDKTRMQQIGGTIGTTGEKRSFAQKVQTLYKGKQVSN